VSVPDDRSDDGPDVHVPLADGPPPHELANTQKTATMLQVRKATMVG
jgi:hypothetical protein